MTMLTNKDIEEALMLEQWGKWARGRIRQDLGIAPQSWVKWVKKDAGVKMEDEKRRTGKPRISDEMACAVDIIVCLLGNREPDLYSYVMTYYVLGLDLRQTGENFHMGYVQSRQTWGTALGVLYGYWQILKEEEQ